MKKIIIGTFIVVGVFSTPVLSTKIHLLYDDIVNGFNPETDNNITPVEDSKPEEDTEDSDHRSDEQHDHDTCSDNEHSDNNKE